VEVQEKESGVLMPRVFLAETNRKFDMSAVHRHGTLTVVSKQTLTPFSPLEAAKAIAEGLKKENFNPTNDFLCLTGNSVIVSILLAVASSKFRDIKILMFDAKSSSYVERMYSNPA
jgi:hypothetical protein